MTRTLDRKPEFTKVAIESIVDNPMLVTKHTLHKDKIKALTASVKDVGFFEGIHARKGPGRTYELMFGHHRVEACRKAGLTHVYLIVRPYTDREMIKGFSRENESSKTVDLDHFLESWLAMKADLGREGEIGEDRVRASEKAPGQSDQDWTNMKVAKALGSYDEKKKSGEPWVNDDGKLTPQSAVCASAEEIGIRAGRLTLATKDRVRGALTTAKRFARLVRKHLKSEDLTSAEASALLIALRNGMEELVQELDDDGKPIPTAELSRRTVGLVFQLQSEVDQILLDAQFEELEEEEELIDEAVEEEVEEELEEEFPESDTDEELEDERAAERERLMAVKELEHAVEYAEHACDRATNAIGAATERLVRAQRKAPADATTKAQLRKVRVALRLVERQVKRTDGIIEKGLAGPNLRAVS